MRALIAGQRNASVGVVLGLVGLLCLLVTETGLTFYAMHQTHDFRAAVYSRCLDRAQYDAASTELRQQEAMRFRSFAAQEQQNPFIDASLRQERVAAWSALADSAEKAVDQQVRGNCDAYRP